MGDDCLKWIKQKNEQTLKRLGQPEQSGVYKRMLNILDSKDKIPYVHKVDQHFYNFWRDEKHVKGIFRRTTLEEYKKSEPDWEIVLDLDALSEDEGENWVWKGYDVLDLPNEQKDRALLSLSRGGADATVTREFNLTSNSFVDPKDGGFYLKEAKSSVGWKARDVLIVGTDFGAGSLTDSGYPRVVKEWKRGTPLEDAVQVFEGEVSDISASSSYYVDHGVVYEWRRRSVTFYTAQRWMKWKGEWTKLQVPDDMRLSTFADLLLFNPRSDWEFAGATFLQGSLVSIPAANFFETTTSGSSQCEGIQVLFKPSKLCFMSSHMSTKNFLALELLDDVKSVQHFWKYEKGVWLDKGQNKDNGLNSVSMWALDSDDSDEFWMSISGYTTPSSLQLCLPLQPTPPPIKALPDMYDASGLKVQQFHATSRDGTKIPYFCIAREDIAYNSQNSTILYGYGGFEISILPGYQATTGVSWLEKGNVLVQANIRGGGEFGPSWHQEALKENRYKAYEDFEAVAEDLIARGITQPSKLACHGGSNGGLLVGNMLVRRPELFGAIICQVPLLDMKRYTKLLAGASWMAEYGDPDKPEQWKYLKQHSPFQLIDPAKVADYPPILIMTSLRDDRVHPAHARKMVAKLKDLGAPNVYYYENIEGGHGGAADNKQYAYMKTLMHLFLESHICK